MADQNNDQKQTRSLRDLMETVAENTDPSSVDKDFSGNNGSNVVTTSPTDADIALRELENSEWFKNMSPENRDQIRAAGGTLPPDPDMADLEKALARSENEYLEELNSKLREEGKEEFTIEQFKGEEDPPDNIESQFRKELEQLDQSVDILDDEGPETNNQKNDRIRELKEFERSLREGTVVNFNDHNDTESSDSAALNFTVKRNSNYEENVKSVLDANNIKFKSKKNTLKKALLKNFVQRHPHVTTPLVNSGIYVTLSGASIPEIIQMSTLEARQRSEIETKKMQFIMKHLVDTSIGKKMNMSQFLKLIYHKDIQTLYFNFLIGSFPGVNEFPVVCENEKCKADLKLQINAADLVLNAHEFEEASNYILYQNTDISEVLEQSALSKEKRVILNNGIVVTFTNPSIYDVILLTSRLERAQSQRDLSDYQRVAGYLMYISSIALPDSDTDEYVLFDSIEDMLEILMTADEHFLDEIDQHIEEYTERNVVKYGLKSYTCPTCKTVHEERELDMSDFLFTLSHSRWAMKEVEKMKREEQRKKEDA